MVIPDIKEWDWSLLDDHYSGEPHFMVVDAEKRPIFDSVNRSPDGNDAKEKAEMYLASMDPKLCNALEAFVNEQQPLGIDRETYQNAVALLFLIDEAVASVKGGAA